MIDGLQCGDEKIQTAFYRQHRSAVFSFVLARCARNNNHEDAEEITNDAFVVFFSACTTGKIHSDNKLLAWVQVAAKNKARNFYRVKRNRYDMHNDSIDSLEELAERENGA